MIPSTFIHVRHGETDWNADRRLQGAQDIPLNATGRAQAARNGRELGEFFAREGRAPGSFRWFASPLSRARHTMAIVRTELGLDPAAYTIVPDLIELSFGVFEGLTYDEVADRDPAAYHAILTDKWNFLPPSGESYVMLSARIARFLDSLRGGDGDVVVVSHGGVYRALKAMLQRVPDPGLADLFVPQDRVFVWRDGEETSL